MPVCPRSQWEILRLNIFFFLIFISEQNKSVSLQILDVERGKKNNPVNSALQLTIIHVLPQKLKRICQKFKKIVYTCTIAYRSLSSVVNVHGPVKE